MNLSTPEHEVMEKAGTKLITIAEPSIFDRDDVPFPAGVALQIDFRNPDIAEQLIEQCTLTEPLPGGLGRYMMFGACGNLEIINGREQCAIYEDRPKVCREFEMGEATCLLLRRMSGADPI